MAAIVITGCGRSGTAYTSAVLQELGIRCGHERVFKAREPVICFDGSHGDSSWYAAPFLSRLPPGCIVFHQVRPPLDVIASWAGRRTFRSPQIEGSLVKHVAKRVLRSPPSGKYATYRFLRTWCPAAFREGGEAARAARYWVEWNLMVEREAAAAGLPYRQYRLDEIAAVTEEIAAAAGVTLPADASARISSVSNRTNGGRSSQAVQLADLPAALGDEVQELANRYRLKLSQAS